jgi:hypothetical protein
LVSKDKDFGFQPSPRPEQSDQDAPDQSAKIAHRERVQPIRGRGQPFWVCGTDSDVELMTQKEVLDFKPAPWMIANIASDDALILPHHANPAGLNFRERQDRVRYVSRARTRTSAEHTEVL